MKKVVKLGPKEVRKLIKEAIQGRQPGSPLFTPPPEKPRLREHGGLEGNFPLVEAVTEAFRNALIQEWSFNPDDPSMAAAGEESWQMQQERAVEEFMNEVSEVIDRCVDKLVQGEHAY